MTAAPALMPSSSSSRRKAGSPPGSAPPGSASPLRSQPPLPSPAPSPAPAWSRGRQGTERQIPVYTPVADDAADAEHSIEQGPAYISPRAATTTFEAERKAHLAALSARRVREEVAAAWAALPAVLYGGLTVAGCVWHLRIGWAAGTLILTGAAAALPFVARRRFLPVGVAVGMVIAVAGTGVLHSVGGILTVNAWRAWRGGGTPVGGGELGSRVDDWLCFGGLALVWLLSAVSVGRGLWFEVTFFRERRGDRLAADSTAGSAAAWAAAPTWAVRWRRCRWALGRQWRRLRAWVGWQDGSNGTGGPGGSDGQAG